VTATATVKLSALPEDRVGASGEAVKVQIPELVLVNFDLEQGVCALYHVGKVLLKKPLKVNKFHVVFILSFVYLM
jgi:hypothetical protein